MRWAAVIFDLFGTLVPNLARPEHEAVLGEMARILGAPPGPFIRGWMATGPLRMVGQIRSPEDNAAAVCRDLGLTPSPQSLAGAGRIRRSYTERSLQPRPDAAETLQGIGATGRRIGLLTDCSSEVPARWTAFPLAPMIDAAVFSCVEGACKPAPRLYELACNRLGVASDTCVYVGDGGSRELTGAAAVGMRPVLLVETDPHAHQLETEAWTGERVAALPEVLALLDER